jgi:hypothetical protein
LTSFCARLYGRRSARNKATKALHAGAIKQVKWHKMPHLRNG